MFSAAAPPVALRRALAVPLPLLWRPLLVLVLLVVQVVLLLLLLQRLELAVLERGALLRRDVRPGHGR